MSIAVFGSAAAGLICFSAVWLFFGWVWAPPEENGVSGGDFAGIRESAAQEGDASEDWTSPVDKLSAETLLREMLGSPTAGSPHALIREPEKCLLRAWPYQLAYASQVDVVVFLTHGGVYGLEVGTGKEIWHRYLESPQGQHGAAFGGNRVLGWSNQGVFLLDIATGREMWWRKDMGYGEFRYVQLSPDGTQVFAVFERACILYDPTARSRRVLPKAPADAWFSGWLPGDGGLLFRRVDRVENARIEKFFRMDSRSGAVTSCWEARAPLEGGYVPLCGGGKLAEAVEEGEDSTTLRVLEALTGRKLKEFKGIRGKIHYFHWLEDGRRLLGVTTNRKEARVIDAETGAALIVLTREGHRFDSWRPYEDRAGNAWICSQDAGNSTYVWPLVSDGQPRKVLDGAGSCPGWGSFSQRNPGHVIFTNWLENQYRVFTAVALDGLRKAAEWRVHVQDNNWDRTLINQAMTHLVRSYPIDPDDNTWPQEMAYGVFVQDRETSIFSGQGDPRDISHDGKYLIVQVDNSTADLCDLERGEVVHQFSTLSPQEHYNYMRPAFSADGRRLVVNTTKGFWVMELAGDYPRWSFTMDDHSSFRWSRPILSFDGTRMLCCASNRAGLFDTATGAQLRVFEETERFVRPYKTPPGFWRGLTETAKTWAGAVSDRFKENSYVEAAFSEDETRVITWAAGQVIRVWDADSGALLHTMHTRLPERRDAIGTINNRVVVNENGRYAFCYNENGYGPASLWSLADGGLQSRYQWPQREYSGPDAVISADGSSLYTLTNANLFLWPGAF